MENNLVVKGTQIFMGISIPIIEGGFGENKGMVTAKSILEIHNIPLKEVTKSINRLKSNNRLKELVDFIDLKPQVNTLHINKEALISN